MLCELRLQTLRRRAQNAALGGDDPRLEPLADTGLAHDHVRIVGTPYLLRVPKQSQLALSPEANLHYQAACFRRAAPSGHTPKLWGIFEPGEDLPLGALVVEAIDGGVAQLPAHLAAMAQALAALHDLPLPLAHGRPPLKHGGDPLGAMLDEIRAQAAFLPAADVHPDTRAAIDDEIQTVAARGVDGSPLPITLISFDAHPGNFIVDPQGRAMLVDLEKGRYSAPGFDLAHATLYTSTTWDVATHAVLSVDEVAAFYRTWLMAVSGDLAAAARPGLLTTRRAMWLWSVTWCAKWQVESRRSRARREDPGASAEDWSADLSETSLVAHVADRVAHYLDPATVARVRREWCENSPLVAALENGQSR
ncbi:MAG: phosphotransferase family protein [Candidatus Competibacterales bacterium]